jgi:hypothetical protein
VKLFIAIGARIAGVRKALSVRLEDWNRERRIDSHVALALLAEKHQPPNAMRMHARAAFHEMNARSPQQKARIARRHSAMVTRIRPKGAA